jgi:L-fuculose-phosphate aldolase
VLIDQDVRDGGIAMNLSQQIVDAGWRLLEAGLTDGTSGNISVRGPDGERMLITPTHQDWRFLRDRDLVWLDLTTGNATGLRKPSSEWRLHASIYAARPDVQAIVHHHGAFASAVAVARKTIPVLVDEAADIGPIPTAPYAPSASQELAETVSAQLSRGSNAVLLANHGAVAVGGDLPEAVRRALEIERLAKIYIGAEILGGAQALDKEAVAKSRDFFETYRSSPADGRGSAMSPPKIGGRVSLPELVTFGFRSGVTFASLLQALILQKLHR